MLFFSDEDLPKRPKLFLLYEDDHQYHRKVVHTFASYLQQHCQCDLMCVEWHLDAPWVHQDLQKADKVIVVNSEGAYKSYMSVYGKRNHYDSNYSSTGSSQMSSINSIRNKFLHEEPYDHIVMVYFEYTSERYILPDICRGFNYKLMKHFTDFLLHVHNLHRAENLSRYDLPLDGNHRKRPIGLELEESILEAAKYEHDNPDWSVKHFGRMYSHTSDDSRYDSGLQADMSPGQSPEVEKSEPWSTQAYLQKYLNGADSVTLTPSQISVEIQKHDAYDNFVKDNQKSHLFSSIDSQNQSNTHPNTVSIPNQNAVTYDNLADDFIPPDDIDDDIDTVSKTFSEQMKNIVDRYNTQKNSDSSQEIGEHFQPQPEYHPRAYDRNNDLYFLNLQSGEIPLISCSNADVVSLGGESV